MPALSTSTPRGPHAAGIPFPTLPNPPDLLGSLLDAPPPPHTPSHAIGTIMGAATPEVQTPMTIVEAVKSEVQAHTKIDQGATVTEPNDTRPAKAMRGGRWAHRREGSEAGAGGDAGRPGETSLPVGGVTAEPEPMETGLVGSCVIA